MNINTICVCGAGTMGSGIAQVAATAGFATILHELNGEVLNNAKAKLEKDLQTLVDKGKMPEQKKAEVLQLVTYTSNVNHCKGDVVIEAIIEKPDIKTALFTELAGINPITTIFATNTSSLSIAALAAGIPHPERFAGLHFFNPAPLMKLVEIVKGNQTAEAVVHTLIALTNKLAKTPVVCRDAPGFIVNRVARPYYIEALRLAEAELAPIETIDRLLESRGFKMGPFKLMDLIGNDVNYAVSCSVYEQLHQPERLKPSPLQKEKVDQHQLGKKTGCGYYNYE